jgi:hypothetical protein
MTPDLGWDRELQHRPGAPTNLLGIDVFCDFQWSKVVGHPQTQFPHGQCLARRVKDECPDGLKPALLLTDRDDAEERTIQRDGHFAVVVNLPRYLERANSDASAAYFGDSVGPGLTRLRELEAVSRLSPAELDALVDIGQSRGAIERWVAGNASRVEELREILAANTPAQAGAPIAEIAEALSALEQLGGDELTELNSLLSDSDWRSLVNFINESGLLANELIQGIELARRGRAVLELEKMLARDLTEAPWQSWFESNDWVLGSEFVGVLDEREIDLDHIADFIMHAYDGFVDLVEIKRPEGGLKFWANTLDHGNYVPHQDLVKAITQATRYILEVEREANTVKFLDRLGGIRAIKPRCVLIFGRSVDWNDDQREAYRMLNASYHSLTILTFDHVLDRAKRMLNPQQKEGPADESH